MSEPSTAPPRLSFRTWLVVVAAGTVVAVTLGYVAVGLLRDDGPAGCDTTVLRVTAAPEIAPVVTEAAAGLGACTRVVVTAEDPGRTARAATGGGGADVWIPDSSRWLGSGSTTAPTSVASSPAVLAVRASLARGLGGLATYDALAADAAVPSSLAAPDLRSSAVTQAVLADLRTALGSTVELRGRLGQMLRGLRVRAGGLAPSAPVQVATEQQVRAANAAAGRRVYVPVGPAEAGRAMDYPFVVTAFEKHRAAAAHALLARLTSPAYRTRLAQLGFATGAAAAHPLTADDGDATAGLVAALARPSRILAVVDVSGSMTRPVPEAGGRTRIDLARDALREGMRLFPDHTVAGLWRFSANLTPGADYAQVVPLTEITARTRPLVADATAGLTVRPNGGTGLYATTLAAVRAVRAGYDPTRVNSVVVLSDGRDEKAEAHHIDLPTLLATLQDEADPDRPVVVNMIAYGPDADAGAMQQIATATGGTVFAVRDPRQLPGVFRDALGSRLCDPDC